MNKIWEGVYRNFSDVSTNEYSFDSKIWSQSQLDIIEKILSNESRDYYKYLIKPVFDLYSLSNENIEIIDFGGGLAVTYLSEFINTSLVSLQHYAVIERQEICNLGNKLLKKYTNLSFYNQLINKKTDIVFCGSSFHYVEDWKSMLIEFFKLSPDIILFSDLPIGPNKEFITSQNYYSQKIPVRFFNLHVFKDYMFSNGYRLSYVKEMPDKYNNHFNAFEADYRLDSFKELLFVKI